MAETKLPQYIAALAAANGAFITGTLLGWTSNAGPRLVKEQEYDFPVNEEQFSWVGAALTLGAALSPIPIGFIINVIGKKLTMMLLVIPLIIGWALLLFAQNVIMLYIGRFILGLAAGSFCVCCPIYIGEIAGKEIRGTLGSFFQLGITIGILFAYIVGAYLPLYYSSMFCQFVPISFLAIMFMPESPVYMVSKGDTEGAINAIRWLRGKDYDAAAEVTEIKMEKDRLSTADTSSRKSLLKRSSIRALIISIGLMFFQQLSGINTVIFYTSQIFGLAKTGIKDTLATIIVGIVQVIATFISVAVVDKLGRRKLLLLSSTIMAVCLVILGIYFFMLDKEAESVEKIGWVPILALCIYIIMFSLGFGPIPWIIVGEIFAVDIKGLASSIAATTNWLLSFIVTKTFVNFINLLGIGGTFWMFSIITLLATVFVYFQVFETKGKSLIEIQQILES